jgi:opacity protein-like surface antigen
MLATEGSDSKIMRMRLALLLAVFAIASAPALAQNGHSEFSADFLANYQSTASGQNVTDLSSYSGGFLANYRYHFNSWGAVEVNYSRTRYTQFYSGGNGIVTSWTQAKAQELTLAFVYSFGSHFNGHLRPFVEGGTGGLFWSPITAGSVGGPYSQDRAALLYGGGVDWKLFSHISVRAGYRGLLFIAPDFNQAGQFTNARTQMKEPYAGIVVRF